MCLTLAAVHLVTVEAPECLRSPGQADRSHAAPCQADWNTAAAVDQAMQGLHWRDTGKIKHTVSALKPLGHQAAACDPMRPRSPSLRASIMIGSPLVTSSGVAMNNIRSLTGGLGSSGAGLESPRSLKMWTFSSNKEMICSSFLRRSSGTQKTV